MAESVCFQTEEELLDYSLYPYKKLIEQDLLDGVMTSHKRFTNIDPDFPASLSKKVNDIIRRMGFDGFAITDALCMMGILSKYGYTESKGLAIAGGNDLALPFFKDNDQAFDAFVECWEQGMITEAEYEEAMAQELVFKSGIAEEDKWEHCDNESCDYEGTVSTYMNPETTGYYCPVCGSQNEIGNDASQEVYSYFVDTVLEDVARDMAAMNGVDYDSLDFVAKKMYNQKIQQGGYHIYSTLDMDVQKQIDLVYTNLSETPTTSGSAAATAAVIISKDKKKQK